MPERLLGTIRVDYPDAVCVYAGTVCVHAQAEKVPVEREPHGREEQLSW